MEGAATSKIPVAIVGGGITGAMAASVLSSDGRFDITIYDQGRRGPGGRASHRAVAADGEGGGKILPDDPPIPEGVIEFDHGCQFTRADDARMKALVEEWEALGWISEWAGQFGAIGMKGATGDQPCPDFFGLPSNGAPVYIGVGGMHTLPRHILRTSGATVNRGVRVAGMQREEDGMWSLLGVTGEAALHDTAEAVAARASQEVLGRFAAVVLTDASQSSGGWHRASAGVPEALAARVRDRVRVPLFSAMVAFAGPLNLPLDGITFGSTWSRSLGDDAPDEKTSERCVAESPLWFAARSQSKPGFKTSGGGTGVPDAVEVESWTLISTPGFAVTEITETPMQDAQTGAFKPQEDSYLNQGPVPALIRSFVDAVGPLRPSMASEPATRDFPKVVYLQGQRWGSALPCPVDVDGRGPRGHSGSTAHVFDIAYEGAIPPLVYPRPPRAIEETSEGDDRDFLADDALRLYYAGDFVSRRPPGFEAAALSGIDAAEYIRKTIAHGGPSSA